ncbi:MAG: hypothetical protein IT372_16570 [Polyangiaceae bacterium]|nr:hypothetical protein [Polyangiaceae bacterium]
MKRALVAPLLLAAACAGAPPPAGPPGGLAAAPPPRPVIAEPAPQPEPAVASEPPAAPADLAGVIRVANPQRTWGDATRLLATSRFGFLLMGAAQLGPDMLLEEALGPALADRVDLERPVDVAVLGTSGDVFVVSLAVRERQVSRLQDRFILRQSGGLLRVEGVRGAEPEERRMPAACAIAQEDRAGATRLLCAPKPESLSAAPYLAEVIAREPIDVDARVEIRTPALAEVLDEAKRGADHSDDDTHAARLGHELVHGLAGDIEGVTMDLTWAGQDVEVGLGLRLARRSSPLSLALVPATRPDAPPPAAFSLLPRDAGVAFYTQGASKDELAPLRKAAFAAIVEDAVADGIDRAKLVDFMDRLGKLVWTGGPLAVAAGVDGARADKALAAYQEKKADPRAREAARRALSAWLLAAIDDPPGPWIDGVKELVRLSHEHKRDLRKSAAARRAADATEETDMVVARAPASLPGGTLHVEIRTRPLKKGGPPAHTAHFYAAPAGGRLWLGLGEDDAAVIARLRAVLSPAAGAQTLAALPGAAALQRPGLSAGGLVSLLGAAGLVSSGDTPEDLDEAAGTIGSIASLPSRGEIPLFWAMQSEVLPAGAARWGLRVRLPAAAIQDAITALAR